MYKVIGIDDVECLFLYVFAGYYLKMGIKIYTADINHNINIFGDKMT